MNIVLVLSLVILAVSAIASIKMSSLTPKVVVAAVLVLRKMSESAITPGNRVLFILPLMLLRLATTLAADPTPWKGIGYGLFLMTSNSKSQFTCASRCSVRALVIVIG